MLKKIVMSSVLINMLWFACYEVEGMIPDPAQLLNDAVDRTVERHADAVVARAQRYSEPARVPDWLAQLLNVAVDRTVVQRHADAVVARRYRALPHLDDDLVRRYGALPYLDSDLAQWDWAQLP